MSSVRLFGQISRLISNGGPGMKQPGMLAVANVATSIKTQNRPLYNQPTWTTASNQQQATTNSASTRSRMVTVGQPPVAPGPMSSTPSSAQTSSEHLFAGPMTELDYKLNEIKVFQDEQIIQLVFKSGQTVNYTMNWLRNLCPCSECMSNKFQSQRQSQSQQRKSSSDGSTSSSSSQWSVARIRCNSEDDLEIEWLDNEQYHSHTSLYNLKYLSIYGQSDPRSGSGATTNNYPRI